MKNVNLDKIDKMALVIFRNAIRLHLDSITLFRNNSFPSAFFLSVIALEELGKIFLITDFLFNSRVNGRLNKCDDEDLIKIFGKNLEEGYFKKIVYNHKRKQFHFVRTFDSDLKPSTQYFKKIIDGNIENEKQDALYVGLKRIGKKNRYEKPINKSNEIDKKNC
jgi:AbiV family abortive infection protein